MSFLIRQTLVYAVPLMLVALAGVFAERSGIINLALEGIMIFGAFMGVLFVRTVQEWGWFQSAFETVEAALSQSPKAVRQLVVPEFGSAEMGSMLSLQGFGLLAMLFAALSGAVFSLLLAFAAINLKADQTIGGTALNMLAPALVLFLIRIIVKVFILFVHKLNRCKA